VFGEVNYLSFTMIISKLILLGFLLSSIYCFI